MSFNYINDLYNFSLSAVIKRKEQEEEKLSQIDSEIAMLMQEKADTLARTRFTEVVKEVVENLAEHSAFTTPMEHSDYSVMPRERKTRVDVLTTQEAIKACKSSRSCKLKPKTPTRDQTKTHKSKTHTKNKRYSSNRKEAAWEY